MDTSSPPSLVPPPSADKANELRHAFDLFNQVSAELTQAYEALQRQVESLTGELAVANGELRRQYREKEALSERLTLLLNALPAGVVVMDGEGRVDQGNPAALAMLGDGLVGALWNEQLANRFTATSAPDEWEMETAAGMRRVTVAESALASGGGQIFLIHDITAAHEMKASLERNQRLAAMGEMAASLAHQLRTPLSTALLYTGNLARADLASEARARFADRATDQLKRLERLIQDVLLFARGQSIGREIIPLSDYLAEAAQAVEAVSRARNVALQIEGGGEGTIIVGGRKPLVSALVALLENAVQASEPGGTVELRARVTGQQVRVMVRDAGPGVPPELCDRIFEPFFTTRGQGTGLGLAIALGVARAHGGSIELMPSRPGAEFAIILPAGRPDQLELEPIVSGQ